MSSSIPQSVTPRYAANLLRDGQNRSFKLMLVEKKPAIIDGHRVGYYYEVHLETNTVSSVGVGSRPIVALIHALEKLGVTFR